jgi:hypothetical protein
MGMRAACCRLVEQERTRDSRGPVSHDVDVSHVSDQTAHDGGRQTGFRTGKWTWVPLAHPIQPSVSDEKKK